MKAAFRVAVFAGLLASCAPLGGPANTMTATDAQSRALAWADVIARASRQSDFAGADRTSDVLFVGYTKTPESNLTQITSRPDVRAFQALRTLAEMDTALAEANRFITSSAIPYVALAKDYRTGAIVITDVENAQKVGPYILL